MLKTLTTETSHQDLDLVLGDNQAKVWPSEGPILGLSSPANDGKEKLGF